VTRITSRVPIALNDAFGVDRQPRSRVVTGQVDGDRLMLRLFEERHDPMPVPLNTTAVSGTTTGGLTAATPNG
jgi:hypothetical protein